MIRILVLALLLAPAAPALAAPATSPLLRTVHAPAAVAYRGEQVITTWLGEETQATLVQIEHDPLAWTRLEYRPMGLERGWVIFRRGAEEIRYDPATRTGTRATRDPVEQLDEVFSTIHLPLLQSNYEISSTAGTFLGRSVDRVELRPRFADRPTRRIDVDRATGVTLRSERISPEGRLTQLTAFLSFEVLPPGWSKTTAPPANLRLARQPAARATTPEQAARRFGLRPTTIATPPGFQRVADYLLAGPAPVWQTVYSDGVSTLILSRQAGTVPRPPAGSRLEYRAGGPVWLHDFGLKHLIHWAHGGWLITMVGEVTADSLLAAADQTGVAPAPRLLDRLLAWLRGLGLSFFTR